MPELPEVEIVARTLRPQIVGESIISAEVLVPKLRYAIDSGLARALQNARIVSIERIAKYLLCHLDNDSVLIVHLGMTGRFYVRQDSASDSNHQRVVISLSNNKQLIFADARKFGLIDLLPKQALSNARYFQNLGVDPLSEEFNVQWFQDLCAKKRSVAIKQLLMDNRYIQGIGNIYANEILFHCGINPIRLASSLTKSEIDDVINFSKKILEAAIEAGGSSIKDFVDSHGRSGNFQQQFKIYGRDQQACQHCQATIMRLKQSGRSSFFCPICQPAV